MRSKLSEYDEEFAYKWDVLSNKSRTRNSFRFNLVSGWFHSDNPVVTNLFVQYKQKLIDNLIRTMLTNLTVTDFMKLGNTADDFLDKKFFRCGSDKDHPDKKCMWVGCVSNCS